MSDEVQGETFTMPLAGREIAFRRPALGQVLILERMYHREVKNNKDADEKTRNAAMTGVLVRTLDFIDTLVVVEQDRQFIEDQMLAGTIDWPDVMRVLSGGKADQQEEDDADPRPLKRARAVKKVATRARTKR